MLLTEKGWEKQFYVKKEGRIDLKSKRLQCEV